MEFDIGVYLWFIVGYCVLLSGLSLFCRWCLVVFGSCR